MTSRGVEIGRLITAAMVLLYGYLWWPRRRGPPRARRLLPGTGPGSRWRPTPSEMFIALSVVTFFCLVVVLAYACALYAKLYG